MLVSDCVTSNVEYDEKWKFERSGPGLRVCDASATCVSSKEESRTGVTPARWLLERSRTARCTGLQC